jgi:putative oxidoreductase
MRGLHFSLRRSYSRIDWALFAARLILGLILIVHGSQLLFGTFDGPGLEKTLSAKGPGGGGLIGFLVAIGEFFGGLAILLGFLARFAAAANILIMIGAIILVHSNNGFFNQAGGIEFPFALIGLCLPILIAGPGLMSLGRAFSLVKPANVKTKDPTVLLE